MAEAAPERGAAPAPGARKSAAAFRTISEVADDLDVAQHVLRFWESKFPQVRPLKRGGGRRYYRPEDVDLLRQIRGLLYEEGYTIKGVQKLLRAKKGAGVGPAAGGTKSSATVSAKTPAQETLLSDVVSDDPKAALRDLRLNLEAVRDRLKTAGG